MNIVKFFDKIDRLLVLKIGVTNSRRLGRFLVGLIPFIGTITFVIHCVLLIGGGESHIAGFLFKFAFLWFALLTILSIAFEFCWVHRAFLLYDYLIGVCIEHQEYVGFGVWLTPLRWFFLVFGLLLLLAFVLNNCWIDFIDHTKHYK